MRTDINIGDDIVVTCEIVCTDYVPKKRTTTIHLGDTGRVVATDDDRFQVLMRTGNYAGTVTDVSPDNLELSGWRGDIGTPSCER